MFRSIGLVTFSKLVIQAIGFLTTIIIAREFGVGGDIGVYFYAYGLILTPIVIFNLSARSLVVTELNLKQLEKQEYFSSFIAFLIKFSVVSAGIATIFLLLIVELNSYFLFLSLDSAMFKEIVYLLLPMSFLLMLSEIFTGVFNSKKKFGWPESTEILKVCITLAALVFLSDKFGVLSLVWGNIAGSLVSTLLLFVVIKKEYLIGRVQGLNIDKYIADFKNRFYGLVSSNIIIAIQPFIVLSYIALINSSSVSLYSYLVKVVSIPSFLLSSVIFVAFSHWSDFASNQQNQRIIDSALNVILSGGAIIGAFLIVVLLEGGELVSLLFGDNQTVSYDDFLYLAAILIVSSILQFGITALTRIMQALRMVKDINIYRVAFFLVSVVFVHISSSFLEGGLEGIIKSLLFANAVMLMYVTTLLRMQRVITAAVVFYVIKATLFVVILAFSLANLTMGVAADFDIVGRILSVVLTLFIYLLSLIMAFRDRLQPIMNRLWH